MGHHHLSNVTIPSKQGITFVHLSYFNLFSCTINYTIGSLFSLHFKNYIEQMVSVFFFTNIGSLLITFCITLVCFRLCPKFQREYSSWVVEYSGVCWYKNDNPSERNQEPSNQANGWAIQNAWNCSSIMNLRGLNVKISTPRKMNRAKLTYFQHIWYFPVICIFLITVRYDCFALFNRKVHFILFYWGLSKIVLNFWHSLSSVYNHL